MDWIETEVSSWITDNPKAVQYLSLEEREWLQDFAASIIRYMHDPGPTVLGPTYDDPERKVLHNYHDEIAKLMILFIERSGKSVSLIY
ncbi:MAG: hypothetical protein ACLP4V_27105 [Methylocella sp.]